MRVFLFGAGASYGSGDVDPAIPPLGSELYDVLARLFTSTWGQIPAPVQSELRSNFEVGMGNLIDDYGFAVAPLMQRMAIFFARFGLSKTDENLYSRFFSHLRVKGIISDCLISTLNYECLLEIAAGLNGFRINYFADPIDDDSNATIWKLHGSCNFKVSGIDADRSVQFGAAGFELGNSIESINPAEVRRYYSGNTSLYPAMSLYAKNKPVSMAAPVIRHIQAAWAEKVTAAREIYVIGVRPNPDDVHIWAPIADSQGTFFFVGNQNEFNTWCLLYRPYKSNMYLGSTWQTVFGQLCSQLF
jgi:hypothetical protein